MKEETLNKYIGKKKGVMTILELDHETYDKEKQIKRSYFKVRCSVCGHESVVRADKLSKGAVDPQSCEFCNSQLKHKIADEKYKKTRNRNSRYNSIKWNAIGRGLNFPFSREEVDEYLKQPCFYCGSPYANGIDRIDSSKDYSKDNCVPCCAICNKMKNKFSLDLFLDKVEKIYKLHHNESSTTISKESTSQANGDGSGELLNAA